MWICSEDYIWTRRLNNGGDVVVWPSDIDSPTCQWTITLRNAVGMATESWPGYKISRGAKSVATLIAKDYGFLIE